MYPQGRSLCGQEQDGVNVVSPPTVEEPGVGGDVFIHPVDRSVLCHLLCPCHCASPGDLFVNKRPNLRSQVLRSFR